MGMGGTFQEVTRPSRIVATEVYEEYWTGGETLVTTELVETRSKTTLSTTVRYASREARDAAIKMGATKGLEASYNRLDNCWPRKPDDYRRIRCRKSHRSSGSTTTPKRRRS